MLQQRLILFRSTDGGIRIGWCSCVHLFYGAGIGELVTNHGSAEAFMAYLEKIFTIVIGIEF